MERITRTTEQDIYGIAKYRLKFCGNGTENQVKGLNKLGEYEDLEEEYAKEGVEDLYQFLKDTLIKIKMQKIESIVALEIDEEEIVKLWEEQKFDECKILELGDIKKYGK